MIRYSRAPEFVPALLGLLIVTPFSILNAQTPSTPRSYEGTAGGTAIIEEGQPVVILHPTVENADRVRKAHTSSPAASKSNDLSYHGGTGGIGVETMPKLYLVLWGSQWDNDDPSGEAGILESFYSGVGGAPG
jgi:serine protease